MRARLTITIAWLCVVWLSVAARAGVTLEPDPMIEQRVLGNGLQLAVQAARGEPGRVSMMLIIRAGSLHEDRDAPGTARLVPSTLFSGSARFEPGELVDAFRAYGVDLRRERLVQTRFRQTFLTIDLPTNEPDAIALGMRLFADALDGLRLDDASLRAEVERADVRDRLLRTANQRVNQAVLRDLVPGWAMGEHPPQGTPEARATLETADLERFAQRWYRPDNAAIVVVGDIDAPALADRLAGTFGAIDRPREALGELALPVTNGTGPRAIITQDPDVHEALCQLLTITPAEGPLRDEADIASSVIDDLAMRVLELTMEDRAARAATPVLVSHATTKDAVAGLRVSDALASGPSGTWDSTLDAIVSAVSALQKHGVPATTLERARRALQGEYERVRAQAPSRDARRTMYRLADRVTRGDALPSPRSLARVRMHALEQASASDVRARLVHRFDLDHAIAIVVTPTDDAVPSEQDVLALIGSQRIDASAELDEAEDTSARSLLPDEPAPGEVAEITIDHETGVASAWLGNNVRVRHRYMIDEPGRVRVSAAIAGGRLFEDDTTRGISAAASSVFNAPAGCGHDAPAVRALLAHIGPETNAELLDDVIRLSVSFDSDGARDGFRLLHMLLSMPTIEPASLERWRSTRSVAARVVQSDPNGIAVRLLESVGAPSDARTRPLLPRDVENPAFTPELCESWLDAMLAGPIEVAVVGDIDRWDALSLAAEYLGSIETRSRVARSFTDAARIVRPDAARETDVRAHATGGAAHAVVAISLPVRAHSNDDHEAALSIAAQSLEFTLRDELVRDQQLALEVFAGYDPSPSHPGLSNIRVIALADPAHAEELLEAIGKRARSIAKQGFESERVELARSRVVTSLEDRLLSGWWWARQLSLSTLHDREPDAGTSYMERVATTPAADVSGAFADAVDHDGVTRVLVLPAEPR